MVLQPIAPETLRARLSEGVVQFAFKKVDGTLRTAVGTTTLATILFQTIFQDKLVYRGDPCVLQQNI